MVRALLFDLDDTLIVEEAAAASAFEATARYAASIHDVDVAVLASDARTRARQLWHDAPSRAYCLRIGISSWEGLWCRFEGHDPELRRLRQWASAYRREAWRLALADQDVHSEELAADLGDRFVTKLLRCRGRVRRVRRQQT